jgi:hypothetical protein
MGAKLVFILAGALALGGCNSSDPTVFPYSKEQVQKMLMDADTTLPRRDGAKEMIKIWSNGRTSKGVTLNMKYASWAPLVECEAVTTSIKPNETRVVADCGKSTNGDSAITRTRESLRAPMFEEHIAATLNKRKFNRANVDAREVVTVFKNLPAMQSEALQMSMEDARQRAAGR